MADDKEDQALLDELEREAKDYDKDAEIDRILKAFKLNAYEVLDLLPGVPESDIKMCYRKKSLLIHPDKTKNPSAPEAFDRLKKAQTTLMEEKERERLDEAISDARMLVMREKKWTVDSPELKERWFLKTLWPKKAKEVLIDNEMRRIRQRKAQMQEEGRAQRQEEQEIAERKRKRDEREQWEASRDDRISSWRDYQNAKTGAKPAAAATADKDGKERKKKKPKLKVLG